MKARGALARFAAALLLAAAPGAQGVEADLLDLSLEQLADLKITTVSRVEERLADAPAAVFVITRDEIRRSGVTTIAEALRLAPGVEVARRNAHSWSITIRGFNSDLANKLLVLIDGRSVYSPLYAGVFWDVQDVLLEDVERIEVIGGPGGTLWGANAVNGVINVITRPAAVTSGAFAEVGGGNEERGFAGFRYGAALRGGGAARGYVKAWDRDSLKDLTGGDGVDEARLVQGGFRVDWAPGDADELTLQGDVYRGDEAGVFRDPFTLGTLPAGSSVGKADLEGGNVLARWSRGLGNGGDLSLQTYYDYTSRDIPNIYAEDRDTFDVDFQHRLRPAGHHDVLWGTGFRWTGDEIANTTFVTFDPAERQDRTWSAFLQDKIALRNERMFVTLGSKFEHNDYAGFEAQPNARFSWIINERRAFWSSVSRAARIPSRLDADLRLTVPVGMLTIPLYVTAAGSRDFDSEKLVATEAGYRVRPAEQLSFDVAVFRHDYDRLQTVEPGDPIIVLTPPAYAVLPQTLGNLLTGTATGGTFMARWQVAERWRLRFQYTRLDLDLATEPGSGDTSRVVEGGNSPEDQVAVYSYVDLPRGVQLYTGVRYVDELPNQNVESYIAVNAGAAWSPRENLDISLSVDNLNDARHVEFADNQIERSAILRARWAF